MTIKLLLLQLLINSRQKKHKISEEKIVKKQYMQKLNEYKEEMLKFEAYERRINDKERMVTAGNNFVLQFRICQHPVHSECVKEKSFYCPIDRSRRNEERIFNDYDTFHDVCADSLTDQMKETLRNFIDIYSSFFKDSDIFVELIKSISGLISTYEVRLRNLPDCLNSEKTKILSRNLFLTTWYLYRMYRKPNISLHVNSQSNVEGRLTTFSVSQKLTN